VLGNQVTPIPVTLDGQTHTVTRPLEIVAHTLHAGQTLTVQIVANTSDYFQQRAAGALTIATADVSLPLVDPGKASPAAPGQVAATAKRVKQSGTLRIGAAQVLGRRVRVRVSGRAHGVVVVVRDRGGRLVGRSRVGTVAGSKTVSVRLRRSVTRVRVVATGRGPNGSALRAQVTRRSA
jgi:hypothetical protein